MARLWPVSIRITLLLTVALSSQAFAFQEKSNSDDIIRKSAIRNFANRLLGIPVEYQSDLLFSLLYREPDALPQQLQVRLLRDLFERAPTALSQTPVSEATVQSDTLSHQKVLDLSILPFDTLDIQARTVSLLRSRSPLVSWELMQQISLPTQRVDCIDNIAPILTPYYQVMASSLNAIKSTIVPDGRTKLAYLLQQIDEIKTPAQLQAFAKSVVAINLNAIQEIPILEAVVNRIGAINGSDREMSGVENEEHSLTGAIAGLVEAEKAHDISPIPLLVAYRALLIRNLHVTACADSTLDRFEEARSFNTLNPELIGEDPKPVRALLPQELTPISLEGVAKDEIIKVDGGIDAQLRRIGQVFIANQKAMYQSNSKEEYLQPNSLDVQDVLRHESDLAKNDSLSSVARFENQVATLNLLVIALPPGASFKDAIDAEVAFLNLNPIEQQSPLSWLRTFQGLILISRPTTVEVMAKLRNRSKNGEYMIMLPSPNALFIRETLRRYQSDPIISAYLEYEDIFHPVFVSEDEVYQSPPL